jgi:hypothetical protein
MKRFLLITAILFTTCVFGSSVYAKPAKDNLKSKTEIIDKSKIEVVNESTIIFKDVIKVEIRVGKRNMDQITYVYDLKHSTLVKIARGSFVLELPRGNYLIQSNKRITKMDYKVIAE